MEIIVIIALIIIIIYLWNKNNELKSMLKRLHNSSNTTKKEEHSPLMEEELEELIFDIRDIENQNFNHRLRSGFFKGYIKYNDEHIEIFNEAGLLLGFLSAKEYYDQVLENKYNGFLPIYGYAKYDSYSKYWFGKIIAPYNLSEQDTQTAFHYFENQYKHIFNK